MSAVARVFSRPLRNNFSLLKSLVGNKTRCLSTKVSPSNVQSEEETSVQDTDSIKKYQPRDQRPVIPTYYRHIYPEFLPDPRPEYRNTLREKMERFDMLARRSIIDIPEFYVGSILAVTYSEPHAPGKSNRFVGICIQKTGCGLRASFVLRNVIDNQGVEVTYDLYDPAIQKIDCLKLEKRLDDELLYLRDAPLQYSTIPLDMEMQFLPDGAAVPINKTKVPLNPRPWRIKWELHDMRGIVPETIVASHKKLKRAAAFKKPWEKFDLMKTYRETIPDEEQQVIFSEVYSKLNTLEISRKKMKRKRGFVRPTKQN